MAKYLSQQWLEEADAALRESGMRMPGGKRFEIEQHVDDVVFHLLFDSNGASAQMGAASDPTVVLKQSRATAVAIALGEISSEEAVLAGQTLVEGDPLSLMDFRQMMADADDVFASVRARTTWDR